MNNSQWSELFRRFYYDVECSDNYVTIEWMTRCTNGYEYGWDWTWTHFSREDGDYSWLEWLKIRLTPENRETVLAILTSIHVPGDINGDIVTVYGYADHPLVYL